ncbi:MAG: sulfur oxidation c-type cytochrome SoxA [Thiobacillaceae bacterium]|nr:sulfur oxidation c-type cytochrome SoxA [Thiobacillaceae bacterium]MDW8323980.1 sulfur oxidation c-type cytochrome SoxA [Burkholderiales bacterium]
MTKLKQALSALPLALALVGNASASKAPEDILDELIAKTKNDPYLTQSPQNRMMMPDNPAYEWAAEGEKLFKQPRGPKNASLEKCDFGKGPGVLKGAYVELPRYFADTGRVMDFESRLVHCMKTLQGFTDNDPQIKVRHGEKSDIMKITTYVAMQSNGMPWNPPMNHPLEKAMRDAGRELFFRRAGPMDFNCATCHLNPPGTRIRASVLPNVKIGEEWTKAVSWPAWRVGHEAVRSSQHRVLECLWQMRYPNIMPDSDVHIAIISFWTDAARGQPAILPDMKR